MSFECERPVRPHEQRPFRTLFYTPYWITFELPVIDMKAASIGVLDQIVAGLRQWTFRRSRGGSESRTEYLARWRESIMLRSILASHREVRSAATKQGQVSAGISVSGG
jgi:hypothetical protein